MRSQMLGSAKADHCVGKSAKWLLARFGAPREIARVENVEHWWYTPGPWYFVHEDYVGFEVRAGRIVTAYIQVN
jgi:hypothetical protein